MIKKRFALASSAVAIALACGPVATASASPSSSAKPADSTSNPTFPMHRGSPDSPSVNWDFPEHEEYGEVYIGQETIGLSFFDDYDANIQNHFDRDNFYIMDWPGDGKSVSLTVYHNGKKYSKHAYYGETKMIGVGNIKNGETVKLKACGWKDGRPWGLYCVESEITE